MITEPGIYFGMPKERYLADTALSSSGIKNLLVSPLTYWVNSHMNPDYEQSDTAAQKSGTARHTRILEGLEAFEDVYAVKPSKTDYPDALAGAESLRERCDDLGLKRGGKIADLCERILEADPDAVLWPRIMADFESEHSDKILISEKEARQIELPILLINRHSAASKAFKGGHPEVSIFWADPETGARMKCRPDYLKTRATVDLKNFSNPRNKPVDIAVAHHVASYGFHIQAAVYMDGIEAAKRLLQTRDDAVHGARPGDQWLSAFATAPEHSFVFVFVESGAVPNIRVREFRRRDDRGPTVAWQAGHDAYRLGVRRYQECLKRYGTEPWLDAEPMTPFTDQEFPLWMTE